MQCVGLLGKEDQIYRKLPDIRCSCLFFSFSDKILTINDLGGGKERVYLAYLSLYIIEGCLGRKSSRNLETGA